MLSDGPGIADIALDLLDGQTPTGTQPAWSWRVAGVVLLARPVQASVDTDVALVLDDAPDAVAAGVKEPWRPVARGSSNLLGLRPSGTEITVRSLVEGAPVQAPAAAATRRGTPSRRRGRRSSSRPPRPRPTSCELLAQDGMPAPEFGPEVDGIPLGPTWPDHQLTLDVDLGGGRARARSRPRAGPSFRWTSSRPQRARRQG